MFHVCCKKYETKLIGSRDFSFDIFRRNNFLRTIYAGLCMMRCFYWNYVANRRDFSEKFSKAFLIYEQIKRIKFKFFVNCIDYQKIHDYFDDECRSHKDFCWIFQYFCKKKSIMKYKRNFHSKSVFLPFPFSFHFPPYQIKNPTFDSFGQHKGWNLLFNILNLRSLRKVKRKAECHPTKVTDTNFFLLSVSLVHNTFASATCFFPFIPENLITVKSQWLSNWKESEVEYPCFLREKQAKNSTTWIVIKSLKSLMAYTVRGKG